MDCCSLSDVGNSMVLRFWYNGSSVGTTPVKTRRSLQFKVKDLLDLCKRDLTLIICYRVGNVVEKLLWHVIENSLPGWEGSYSSTSPLENECANASSFTGAGRYFSKHL